MIPVICLALAQTSDFFPVGEQRRFADTLYDQGQYAEALVEYRRWQFLTSSADTVVDHRIIHCLLRLERFADALKQARLLKIPSDRLYYSALVFYQRGDYDSVLACLADPVRLSDLEQRRIVGLSYAEQYNFVRAGEYLDLPTPRPGRRSPWLAGFLSVLPGAGHCYAGRIDDGIYSLLVVGTASLLAWYYHDRAEIAKFAGCLCAGIVFYGGSIYGGINAAQNYNQAENEAYLQRIREENPLSDP